FFIHRAKVFRDDSSAVGLRRPILGKIAEWPSGHLAISLVVGVPSDYLHERWNLQGTWPLVQQLARSPDRQARWRRTGPAKLGSAQIGRQALTRPSAQSIFVRSRLSVLCAISATNGWASPANGEPANSCLRSTSCRSRCGPRLPLRGIPAG